MAKLTTAQRAKLPPDATHLPGGMGRLPENDVTGPPLPKIPRYRIVAVETWLTAHRENRRALTVAAPLLALVCALYRNPKGQQFFPARRRVAEWLRDNGHAEWESERPNSVDKAIQAAIAHDEVEIKYVIEKGNAAEGKSIIRRRYLTPSKYLLDAYDQAGESHGPAKSTPRAAGKAGKGVTPGQSAEAWSKKK